MIGGNDSPQDLVIIKGTANSTMPVKSEVAKVAAAIQNQSGVSNLNMSDQTIEQYDKPTSTLVTTRGRNAANSADAAVISYAFNETIYNKSVLASDNVTASLATVYNDGFLGRNIDRHIQIENLGRGLHIKQITFTGINAAGDQDISVLEAMGLTFLTYTTIGGRQKPVVIDLGTAIRNTQYQQGILTIDLDVWFNGTDQISWNTISGATINANISWGF